MNKSRRVLKKYAIRERSTKMIFKQRPGEGHFGGVYFREKKQQVVWENVKEQQGDQHD
jgi:hypothetical protein